MSPADPSSPATQPTANIARHLGLMAAAQPDRAALKIPRGRTRAGEIDYLTLSFAELDREVKAWCSRLDKAGVGRGDRTLVMVRQGLPLIASVFALFRLGAVPVVIDPGMGLKNFLACVARSEPRALVGIPLAQALSRICRRAFRSVRHRVPASGRLTARLEQGHDHTTTLALADSAPDELAAVLFTSGSTGAPKGVRYEHGMFDAQVRLIRATYAIEPGEIDLPLLPIFALFNPALGMTTVVPEIDPRRPADVDPARIVQAIRQERVTNSFGSPTLWRKIGNHCLERNLTLPSLRRVLCAGAAVPAALWESSRRFLASGKLHSPYGATECLPVATIAADEIGTDSVRGACVGRPVAEMAVRIIAVTERPLRSWREACELPVGEVGEIVASGPVVTRSYDAQPEATALAKIPAEMNPAPGSTDVSADLPTRAVWHRMGDCGCVDADGRIWFVGRKAERVTASERVWYTEPCEQVFRRHPRVSRCALVGLGRAGEQQPAIVIEAKPKNAAQAAAFAHELGELARQYPETRDITVFFFRPRFPVDVRHNAKIHRLTLARWAASARGYRSAVAP